MTMQYNNVRNPIIYMCFFLCMEGLFALYSLFQLINWKSLNGAIYVYFQIFGRNTFPQPCSILHIGVPDCFSFFSCKFIRIYIWLSFKSFLSNYFADVKGTNNLSIICFFQKRINKRNLSILRFILKHRMYIYTNLLKIPCFNILHINKKLIPSRDEWINA